jgi:hypothetical protein
MRAGALLRTLPGGVASTLRRASVGDIGVGHALEATLTSDALCNAPARMIIGAKHLNAHI